MKVKIFSIGKNNTFLDLESKLNEFMKIRPEEIIKTVEISYDDHLVVFIYYEPSGE